MSNGTVVGRNGKQLHKLDGRLFGRLSVIERAPCGRAGGSHWLCRCECGAEKVVKQSHLLDGRSKSCGCATRESSAGRSRENHPCWKGQSLTAQGYMLLNMPDHPNANKNGLVREHAVVMANKIGRPLLPTEQVHHKNGIRHDNREENLELWTISHPSGQRVSDMVEFCQQYLSQYAPHLLAADASEVS